MPKMVTLTIDRQPVTVPEGTLIVDAAKKIGIEVPVFCYHPKMEPVGMCRMCLVEVGRPVIDRATGQAVLEADGSPRLQFGPKMETACTTPVSQGMVVIQNSEKVKAARKDVVEFILTSHPLDCPVCDKGGECPLQNQTMSFGSPQSRFLYGEKMHMEKHVPLGDLIYLDRERCIQCARCVRFQSDLADDPVIGFYQRGRHLEIVTCSEPGFDSYFSGNVTDICPVGALTTADFRFGARPWELRFAASICTHCPVGCNLTLNVRREAKTGGKSVIKRIMPRQNEAVNEIWMCDKGRFAYHFAESSERLTEPLLRKNGELVPATWEAALEAVAGQLKAASGKVVTLAGGRLSNEDLFNLKQLNDHQSGQAVLYTPMAGGDLMAQVGLGQGSNLSELGKGSAILVVACDLEEEAPIWWLRVRQAAKRGAALIVANPRPTKLDRAATHRLGYVYGEEAATVSSLLPGSSGAAGAAAEVFAKAENAVILFGSEGLGLAGSQALARACAELLAATGHTGKPNNGLIGVWQHANDQGAWDAGYRPSLDLVDTLSQAGVVLAAAVDPAGDDPSLAKALDEAGFVVVQELFLTETAKKADVVLPVQAFTEREGTFTSGERRVQRFYPAVPPRPGTRADFSITADLAGLLGFKLAGKSAALAFAQMAAQVSDYAGLTYQKLAETVQQWPMVGRKDIYYGGTSYENEQGLGVQLAPSAQRGLSLVLPAVPVARSSPGNRPEGALLAVPVTRLYDRSQTVSPSALLHNRLAPRGVVMNPEDAEKMGAGDRVWLSLDGQIYEASLTRDAGTPVGVVLVPRSVGLPVTAPEFVTLLLTPASLPA